MRETTKTKNHSKQNQPTFRVATSTSFSLTHWRFEGTMVRDAIHRQGHTENSPASVSIHTFYLSLQEEEEQQQKNSPGSCRHCLQCVEVQSKLLLMEWIVSVVCQGQILLKLCWACQPLWFLSTCVCRSLSVPAAGSSSWPCTPPLLASVPPRCRSFWAAACTYSRGSAPGAAGSASPALHSTAASPGWTWPSTWSLKTRTHRHRGGEKTKVTSLCC